LRKNGLIRSGQSAPIDSDTGKRADHGLRRRTKLMQPFGIVPVKVLLQDEPCLLEKQDAVHILVCAIQYPAYDRICGGDAKLRLRYIPDRDSIVRVVGWTRSI
jgi:hypothetical protein